MVSVRALPHAPIFHLLVGVAALVILIAGIKVAAPLLDPLLEETQRPQQHMPTKASS